MHHQMLTRRASETNPLRSIPLLRRASAVFGWHPLDAARELLRQAERAVGVYRGDLLAAYTALGRANRCTAPALRRMRQSDAMRSINLARKAMRDAHRKLADAQAKAERLENEPELPFPPPVARLAIDPDLLPSVPRVLREANSRWPARTCGSVSKARGWGYVVTITRPHGAGGMVSTHATRAEAEAALDAEFAPAAVH